MVSTLISSGLDNEFSVAFEGVCAAVARARRATSPPVPNSASRRIVTGEALVLITRRRAVLPLGRRALQRRLDAYRHWYNDLRPHAAHDALTPAEASVKMKLPKPVVYRRRGDTEPVISVRRRSVRGDPYLFLPEIDCQTRRRDAA